MEEQNREILGWREDEHGEIVPVYSERVIVSKFGIFFVVDGEILIDAVPVEKGEHCGYAIQYGDHFKFWKSLEPKNPSEEKLKSGPFDVYPKGRVDYIPDKNQFCIYYDPCLDLNDEIIRVMDVFELDGVDIAIENEERY